MTFPLRLKVRLKVANSRLSWLLTASPQVSPAKRGRYTGVIGKHDELVEHALNDQALVVFGKGKSHSNSQQRMLLRHVFALMRYKRLGKDAARRRLAARNTTRGGRWRNCGSS